MSGAEHCAERPAGMSGLPRAAALCSLLLLSCPLMASDAGDWPDHGRDPGEQRFSPLQQINRDSIAGLGVGWYAEFDTNRGQEATPIVREGVLYTSTAWSKVYAFDAKSGKALWSFDPKVPPQTLATGCCDAVNRGVAVDGEKVFVGALDGRLIALDAKTGAVRWSVMTVNPFVPYTITGAPRVIKGIVLIGNGGADLGVRGYVSAFDEATGKLVWRFYTVPNPDSKPDGAASDAVLKAKANSTWYGGAWKQSGGGGTVWDSMAYDPVADLLYVGVGNGGPNNQYFRSEGKGDNLFLSSIIALKPSTGKYVWHYQTTPGESWDYTATQHMVLADLTIDGKPRKVLMQAPKNGFFYVLDRISGELLSATPYTKVTWAKGVDLATGRPTEVPDARYDSPVVLTPGMMGGHSWHPMAFDQQTGLVYIPVQNIAQLFIRDRAFRYRPGQINSGLDPSAANLPDDPATLAAIKRNVNGTLLAWDPVAGRPRWAVPHPSYLNGGVLATAGGLVLQGTAEGELMAYDAVDGRRLWSFDTGNGIVAPPISYAVDGQQYIAVMVGYGGAGPMLGIALPNRPRLAGRLIVFKLGGTQTVAEYKVPPLPPVINGVPSSGDAAAGQALFNRNCFVCHGAGAASRYTADLRRSTMLTSPDTWKTVVIDGAFSSRGMISFAQRISPAEAEDIRAFVLGQARKISTQSSGQVQ